MPTVDYLFCLFCDSAKKVKVVLFNLTDEVASSFSKFGIRNDRSSASANLDAFLAKATNLPVIEVGHVLPSLLYAFYSP